MDQTFFTITPLQQFERLLILGDLSNKYTVDSKNITPETVLELANQLSDQAVRMILEVSQGGRAPKNDFAVQALAIIAARSSKLRASALNAVTRVCRIPTHLFMFLKKYKECGGKTGGRAFRRVLSQYYMRRSVDSVAFLAVKYQSRESWSHRDVLRLLRPKTEDPKRDALFAWIVGKEKEGQLPEIIQGYKLAKVPRANIPELIQRYKLPMEAIPNTSFSEKVFTALLPNMGATALLRVLNRMTIEDVDEQLIINKIMDKDFLEKGRIHPIQLLIALKTYSSGKGDKGKLTWTPNDRIQLALEEAFLLSFKHLPRTTKRLYVGVDISPSMSWEKVAGSPSITSMDVAAAMGMIWSYQGATIKGFANQLLDLNDLYDLGLLGSLNKIQQHSLNYRSTDLSLIIKDAMDRKQFVDAFVVITDNDINSGENVNDMIKLYRQQINPNVKIVVMGTAGSSRTIGDPNDPFILNAVGFDASTPTVIDNFIG